GSTPRRRRHGKERARTRTATTSLQRTRMRRHTTSHSVRGAAAVVYRHCCPSFRTAPQEPSMSPEVFAAGASRVPFSFELYPPRTPSSTEALHETVRNLAAAGPEFISVTYGAGGSNGGRSLEVLRFIRENTDVEPL